MEHENRRDRGGLDGETIAVAIQDREVQLLRAHRGELLPRSMREAHGRPVSLSDTTVRLATRMLDRDASR
jgi:hypothetical protein